MDIRRGDKLVTSGIDGVYPAGLAVATVSQIENTADSPFSRIICVPTGGVENHKQVLLVSIPQLGLPAVTAVTAVTASKVSAAVASQVKTTSKTAGTLAMPKKSQAGTAIRPHANN